MRIFKSVLCIALVFLTAACTEQEFIQGRLQKATIVASIDEEAGQPVTRTVVDESNPEVTGVSWSPGDAIGVYGANGQTANAKFESTNKENSPEAAFSGNIIEGDNPAYAYYPYSEANNDVAYTAVEGEVPQVQTCSAQDGRLSYDYKVGTPKADAASEFAFKHLVTLFRITVDATGIDGLSGEKLEAVTISFPETVRVGGKFSVNLKAFAESKTEAEAAQSITWKSEHKKDLTLQWTTPQPLGNGTVKGYLASAPITAIKDNTVTVKVQTTSRVVSFNAKLKSNFKMGCVYTFPLTLAEWQKADGSDWKNEEKPATPEIFSLGFSADDKVPVDGTSINALLKRRINNARPDSYGSTYTDNTASYYTFSSTLDAEKNIFTVDRIHYLNSRTLKPALTYTEGATIQYGDGNTFTNWNGTDAIDFHTNKVLRVTKGGVYRDYTVNFQNSGLPVVVINQPEEITNPSSGDSYELTNWKAAGLKVFTKASDFPPNATISFYDANGDSITCYNSGVRLRGNSTLDFVKKPFAIKLSEKRSIFGMAKHKRWVLLANWKDHTLMRNNVAFDIANIVRTSFDDGIGWQPSGTFVEVVYNNVHVGNYYLCEQIKVDKKRVGQEEYELDNTVFKDAYDKKDAFTKVEDYCYLLESDDAYDETAKFTTGLRIPFMFKDDVDAGGLMKEYVKDKVITNIEEALRKKDYSTAYANMDLASFVDYWLIQELTMNGETGHPKSVYSYIYGNGPLKAGPVWDFDWKTFPVIGSGGMSTDYSYDSFIISAAKYNSYSTPTDGLEPISDNDQPFMWFPMLIKDQTFRDLVQERWTKIKSRLEAECLPKILTTGQSLAVSWEENQRMWPNDKSANKAQWWSGHGLCGDEDMGFTDAYTKMQTTLRTRISNMDALIQKLDTQYPNKNVP